MSAGELAVDLTLDDEFLHTVIHHLGTKRNLYVRRRRSDGRAMTKMRREAVWWAVGGGRYGNSATLRKWPIIGRLIGSTRADRLPAPFVGLKNGEGAKFWLAVLTEVKSGSSE